MKSRYLQGVLTEYPFSDGKIAIVSGPRQAGKTSLGTMLGGERGVYIYFNWDEPAFRRIWSKEPSRIIPESSDGKPLVVLDEIHKDRTWKRTLKSIYDTCKAQDIECDFYVTGSAHLNIFRRGSDSMLGRYYHFTLSPFSLREMDLHQPALPDDLLNSLFSREMKVGKDVKDHYKAIRQFGPFPEPLFREDMRRWRIWHRNRHEMIIRQDLRDFATTADLGRIELLADLLPGKVASPLSITALREDLEVADSTVRRWLGWLKELYFVFEVKPWSKRISRSLKKSGKYFLWDYSEVTEQGPRFENLVAYHLKKACLFWTDAGYGDFELCCLRTKDKVEIDFLIVRDGQPWLPIEVKSSQTTPSEHWRKIIPQLKCKHALQITEVDEWKLYSESGVELLVAPAWEVLRYFV